MMSLLTSLGIDSTFAFQFVIFLVAYIFIYVLAFKPYYLALQERERLTEGNQSTAEDVEQEALALETEYEEKARTMNQEFKDIYDEIKAEAQKEYDSKLSVARTKAAASLEGARSSLAEQVGAAKSAIEKESPEVAKSIIAKVLGKEAAL